MPTTVSEYFTEERQELLVSYGRNLADDFRDPARPGPLPQFHRDMYDYWSNYYQELIDLTDVIVNTPWTGKQFRNAVRGENQALRHVIDEIDDALNNTHPPRIKQHLRILRQLLRVELRTNKQLIKQHFN